MCKQGIGEQQKWYKQPHASSWLALSATVVGVFFASCASYAFAATPGCMVRYFAQVPAVAARWMVYAVPATAVVSLAISLPAIRRYGVHVVVYASAALLLLGGGLRGLALATDVGDDDTRGKDAFALVFLGTVCSAASVAPLQCCGTLVSTTFPRQGRIFIHAVVRSIYPEHMLFIGLENEVMCS